jgi:hypothetical protein
MDIEVVKKVVYADGNYTKLVYGSTEITDDFVVVTDKQNKKTTIGKRFIISITDFKKVF